MKRKGYFISFEGPEGSGKSTQIRLAKQVLSRLKRKCLVVREPGDTKAGEAIREILLKPRYRGLEKETELLLYLAARAEIVVKRILPALQKGWVVICDRFEDSTLAYQGYGRKMPVNAILDISRLVRGKCQPDRSFLVDIPVKEGLARRGKKLDRMEQESLQFHNRVRRGFLELARKNKKRFMILDGRRPIQETAAKIRKQLEYDLR